MYNNENYGADADCIHCGAAIYFDVGIGSSNCPACGKNYSKTDKEIEEEQRQQEELRISMKTSKYWIEDMVEQLESTISYLDMMFVDDIANIIIPREAMEKSKWLTKELNKIIFNLRRE